MEKGGGTGPTAPSVPVTTSSSSSTAIQLPAIEPLFHTMTSVLRMPGVINNRMVLDPLAKLLSYSLQVIKAYKAGGEPELLVARLPSWVLYNHKAVSKVWEI